MTVGELMVKLGFNVDKSSENKAKQSIDGMKNLAGKALGAIGVTLSISGLSNLAETASSLNALDSQFTQTFGNMEKQAQESLDSIAEYAGMNAGRIKGSYSQIAGFAKTTGADEAEAISLADRAMRVAADSAAYYDRSIEQVTENLQSFLKGNYENDSALGLSATETTRNAKANELYGKSFNDLSEQQKQLTLLQMVEDANKASGALGQAAREADQYTNVMGNMKQGFTEFKGAIGQIVLKPMTDGVKLLTSLMEKATNAVKAFNEGTTPVNKVLDRGKAIIDKLGPPAERVFRIFTDGFSKAGVNGKTFGTALGTVSKGVDSFLSFLEKGADAVSNFLTSERIQAAANVIIPIFLNIGQTASSVFKSIYAIGRSIFALLMEWWNSWGSDVVSIFMDAITKIGAGLQGFMNGVQAIANFITALINGDWAAAWEAAKQIFINWWNTVTNILSGINSFIQGIFFSLLTLITTALSNLWNTFTGFFGYLKESALQWGADFVNGLIEGIKSKIAGVIDAVKGIGDKIRSFLHFSRPDEGPLRDYEQWMPDFMKGMGDSFDRSKGGFLKKIKNLASDMKLLVKAGTPDRSSMKGAATSNVRTTSVVQNNTFNNSYSGGSGDDRRAITKGMKKSATDATTEMARGLAYARG